MEGRSGLTSVFTLITDNPDFLPRTLDTVVKCWTAKGISSLGGICDGPTLMTFNQVMEKYDISRNYLFLYFQVRDFIIKDTSLLADVNVPQISQGEHFMPV